MLVQKWMTGQVKTIDVNESLGRAIKIMKEHSLHILPVMENGNLVGIVTDRDIKRASASDATTLEIHELLYLINRIKLKDVMTKKPLTVPYNYTIEEAAEILMEHNISGLPVLGEDGKLAGIITKNDIFKVILSLTGLRKRGIAFALRVKDSPGSIKETTDIIRAYGGRMVSILSSYDKVPEGYRDIYVRAYNLERQGKPQLVEQLRKVAELRYVIDHRYNTRELYSID
jgi:acetoin utilization protein AcuB